MLLISQLSFLCVMFPNAFQACYFLLLFSLCVCNTPQYYKIIKIFLKIHWYFHSKLDYPLLYSLLSPEGHLSLASCCFFYWSWFLKFSYFSHVAQCTHRPAGHPIQRHHFSSISTLKMPFAGLSGASLRNDDVYYIQITNSPQILLLTAVLWMAKTPVGGSGNSKNSVHFQIQKQIALGFWGLLRMKMSSIRLQMFLLLWWWCLSFLTKFKIMYPVKFFLWHAIQIIK